VLPLSAKQKGTKANPNVARKVWKRSAGLGVSAEQVDNDRRRRRLVRHQGDRRQFAHEQITRNDGTVATIEAYPERVIDISKLRCQLRSNSIMRPTASVNEKASR
jgi:hypothetical protein